MSEYDESLTCYDIGLYHRLIEMQNRDEEITQRAVKRLYGTDPRTFKKSADRLHAVGLLEWAPGGSCRVLEFEPF